MREIGIEHLRKDLAAELQSLPFIILRRGVPIAIVEPYSSNLKVDAAAHNNQPNLTVKPYSSTPDLTVQPRGSCQKQETADEVKHLTEASDKPRLPSLRNDTIKKLGAEERSRAQTHHREGQ